MLMGERTLCLLMNTDSLTFTIQISKLNQIIQPALNIIPFNIIVSSLPPLKVRLLNLP